MKRLLTGVAVVAALAFSAQAGAQPIPGQAGFGPKASGGTAVPPPTPPAAMAPSAEGAPTPASPPDSTAPTRAFGTATRGRHHMEAAGGMPISTRSSATQPNRQAHHKMTARHNGKGQTGSTADQLNQQELARLQAASMPGAPPTPGVVSPPPQPGRAPGTTPGEPRYPGYPGPKSSGRGG
jgi:hypothetical protein